MTVRSNQARATRRAIVAAATELFVEQGYAATTIDAVAERAGVGRKTVFSSVGGKGALLKLAWDWALAGDDEPVPMAQRPAVQAMIAERDPERLVRMWVDLQLDVGTRATPIGAVVLAAADADPLVRALRDLMRSESQAGAIAFVTHLAAVGGLRAGLSVERAADACWALLNSLLQHLLTGTRGWSRQEYGDWLARVVGATLLARRSDVAPPDAVVQIRHEAGRQRYTASVDGHPVGWLRYERTPRLVVLVHTEVDPSVRVDGVADRLVDGVADGLLRAALADLRGEAALRVVPLCPYAAWWLSRHPEHAERVYDPTADPL